jgi:hypothetical protein
MKKAIVASVIALTMGVGGVGAASQLGGVVQGTKKVGQATVDTTKKVVGTAGKETTKAAKKTKNTVSGVRCADGTRQSAKTGCAHHGGIRR